MKIGFTALLLSSSYAIKMRGGEPTKAAVDEFGIPFIGSDGNYNPGASTMDPNVVWQRP